MGDIAFNIVKEVNLNKTINLDIFKEVNVNVDNPDQLATAEADAEAFGSNALAEADVYTFVTESEAFAYSESTAALDLQDTSEVTFFIEGSLGEGENLLSGGSFTGTITEVGFNETGSGTIVDVGITFFDSAGEPFKAEPCTCPEEDDVEFLHDISTEEMEAWWDLEILLNEDESGDNGFEKIEILFDGDLESNEIDFTEGILTTNEKLGESLEVTDARIEPIPEEELGSIGDLVFLDSNGDGINNDGLGGLPEVEVELGGPVSKKTTTNSQGLYLFDNLPSGTYEVTFDLSDIDFGGSNVGAFTQGPDSQVMLSEFRQIATADNINLAPGEENLNIDAGVEVIGV